MSDGVQASRGLALTTHAIAWIVARSDLTRQGAASDARLRDFVAHLRHLLLGKVVAHHGWRFSGVTRRHVVVANVTHNARTHARGAPLK